MILELKHITKTFDNTVKETLQDISLSVEEGAFVCIVGPSGCGKSTLLNIAAGLEQPSEGEVYVDGERVNAPGADRVVMFQESALFPWLTVEENVRFGMKMAKIPKEEQEIRLEKYLKMVQLSQFKSYYPHEISGGMKQRAALARALTLDSKILLMDEPFSALDKQTINILRKELEQIWEQTKKTILYITHSVEEAVYFADRVVVLSDNPGEIKEIIPVDLPRPREIEDEAFVRLRGRILKNIKREAEKIAKAEHDKN